MKVGCNGVFITGTCFRDECLSFQVTEVNMKNYKANLTTVGMQQNEPRREKTGFAYAKTKTQISFAVTAKLISAFVFATRIVQFLFYLNPKFQASSHILWLCSPVCVGPGRKPRRPVFSERGSNYVFINVSMRELVL